MLSTAKQSHILRTTARVQAFQQISAQHTVLNQCLQGLWERPDIRMSLWALDAQPVYWSRQDKYLQTPDTLILLPQTTGKQLLGIALGSSHQSGLTPLEHAILHRLCQQLSRQANLPLGQAPANLTVPVWMTYWLITSQEGYLGQLCIVWPKALAKQLPLPNSPTLQADELPWFQGMAISARIQAGQTYLPLASLPLLEPGDVLVLDQSQINTLVLHTPEGPLRFNTAMSNHVPKYPAMASSTDQPDWNHLMVELTAEFDPFLLPLGEVRAMSEGLLVELDDLAHNTITIHSQGTHLAKGKLVVVGDKFAVRIDRVLGQPMAEATASSPQTTQHTEPTASDDTDEEASLDELFKDEEEQDEW
jgi:flagellar motor switch/type III secretory pathway protein FliN